MVLSWRCGIPNAKIRRKAVFGMICNTWLRKNPSGIELQSRVLYNIFTQEPW
jgi:hypothetical protein